MTDPKVRCELEEGGVPEEEGGRLELLILEYEEAREMLTLLGFGCDILDLQARIAEERAIHDDEEALIQTIINRKIINRPGGLFKRLESVS